MAESNTSNAMQPQMEVDERARLMPSGGAENFVKAKRRGRGPIFWASIVGSIVVVLSVVVAAVIINVNSNDDGTWSPEKVEEVQKSYDDATREIIASSETIDEVIDQYWGLMEGVEDQEKVIILRERLEYLLNLDEETIKGYVGLIWSDAEEIDYILADVESARLLFNIAVRFDDTERIENYARLIIERREAEGADMNEEVRG
ncbi:hypothetical protein IJG90_00635 [Candidatus Saccharibacteria bacterium]|nr:hypothetical protein [Candidatus Saccharibacteria bacterium]